MFGAGLVHARPCPERVEPPDGVVYVCEILISAGDVRGDVRGARIKHRF